VVTQLASVLERERDVRGDDDEACSVLDGHVVLDGGCCAR